jgi:hypothetical protein
VKEHLVLVVLEVMVMVFLAVAVLADKMHLLELITLETHQLPVFMVVVVVVQTTQPTNKQMVLMEQ